jgi:acetyl-CoA carboxylase biotin carboxyl carrier protein
MDTMKWRLLQPAHAHPHCGQRQATRSSSMATPVKAHITGTVWKIEVKTGDAVDAEQVLVILESMKMEMPIEAPKKGTVSSIKVKEGQPVNEGDVVVELD